MISLERLFLLVQSLTKSEKRYFMLSTELQSGEKDYLTLFKILESQVIYDDGIKQKLSTIFGKVSIEPARKHLYKVLMKSLRSFENDKDIEIKLTNLLQDSRILFRKGLTNLSISQLDKMKKLALKHEKFIFHTLAAQQELLYLIRLQFLGLKEVELIEKQSNIKEILEQELHIVAHSSLYEILLFRFLRGGYAREAKDITKLNDLILEEHQILTNYRSSTFRSKQLHLNFQSTYFAMAGQPKESLEIYYELEKLFNTNKILWEYNPLYYVNLIDGILDDLRLTDNHQEIPHFIDSLKNIKSTSSSLKILIKYKIFYHKLSTTLDMNDLYNASIISKEVEFSFEDDFKLIPVQMRSWMLFVLARNYYAAEDYKVALKYLNRILDNPLGIKKSPLMGLCHLLYLQIQTLNSKFDYLDYAMRSVERKFKIQKRLFPVEQLILKAIKRKISYRPIPDLVLDLENLLYNPFNRAIIRDLFLKSWMDKID